MIDHLELQRDLERLNFIDQYKELTTILKDWENDIFWHYCDIPEIYTRVILPLQSYPIELQPILKKHLLSYRKTCNRAGSEAWEYLVNRFSENETPVQKNQATDQKPQNEIEKPLPPIREIFNPHDFFEKLLGKLLENDFCTLNRATGQYFWKNPKSLLAGLTIQLRDKHRLTNHENHYQFDISNNQDLGRLFCQFFNVKYDNKTFQPDRIQDKHKKPFNFITAF